MLRTGILYCMLHMYGHKNIKSIKMFSLTPALFSLLKILICFKYEKYLIDFQRNGVFPTPSHSSTTPPCGIVYSSRVPPSHREFFWFDGVYNRNSIWSSHRFSHLIGANHQIRKLFTLGGGRWLRG